MAIPLRFSAISAVNCGSSPHRVGVFGRSTRLAAFRSGPVLPDMDAEHANGADVSESAAGLPGGHGRETRQTIASIIGYTRRRESRDDASAGFASSASWCSGTSSDPGPDASWHTSIRRLRLTSARRSRRPPAPLSCSPIPQIHPLDQAKSPRQFHRRARRGSQREPRCSPVTSAMKCRSCRVLLVAGLQRPGIQRKAVSLFPTPPSPNVPVIMTPDPARRASPLRTQHSRTR
jgi:hypothetical protein